MKRHAFAAATILVFLGLIGPSIGADPDGPSGGVLQKLHNGYLGVRCYHPPCPEPCESCGDVGRHLCLPWYDRATESLLCDLQDCHSHVRAKAAEKLGFWLRTDAGTCPEVVCSLIYVLQCDSCWDVRKEAAWSIARQKVDDPTGYTVLYLAMKLDPHWMVRDAATDALKLMETQLSPGCIREWKANAAAIEPKCKPYYKPGKDESLSVFASFYTITTPQQGPAAIEPPVGAPADTDTANSAARR